MKRYIVNCKNYNGRKNVLFLMRDDDHRFGTDAYQPVTVAKSVGTQERTRIGLVMHMHRGENGKTYGVFSDWSATEIKS